MIGAERLIRAADTRHVGMAEIVAAEPWMRDALCRDFDPELWYPEVAKGQSAHAMARDAIHVCHECPVRAECLLMATDRRERFGIWGGHVVSTPAGRKAAQHEAEKIRKEAA